jgi:hypothetical protein
MSDGFTNEDFQRGFQAALNASISADYMRRRDLKAAAEALREAADDMLTRCNSLHVVANDTRRVEAAKLRARADALDPPGETTDR